MTPRTAPPTIDGADLYRRCCVGDERAWAEVWRLAYGIAVRRCRAIPSEAEDVAAEACAKLADPAVLGTVKEPAKFVGFVAMMVTRCAIDRLRAPGRRRRVAGDPNDPRNPAMPQQPAPEPDPARSAEDRKAWELVDQAISALGDPGAAVLRAYVEHLQLRPGGSYTTLARQFDTKVGTISSTVWRCVDRLLEDPRVSEALGVERVRAIKAIKAQKRPRAPRPSRREERRP